MKQTLWIVGKVSREPGICWAFQGVFQTEAMAVKACKDELYFVAPAYLNVVIPDVDKSWPGAHYPLGEEYVHRSHP